MAGDEESRGAGQADRFALNVARKAARKQRARREGDPSVWFSLGLFGLVGWSVAIPTVLGLALGIWVDGRWPGGVSWTLTLLFVGAVLGSVNAWYWVKQEIGDDRQ